LCSFWFLFLVVAFVVVFVITNFIIQMWICWFCCYSLLTTHLSIHNLTFHCLFLCFLKIKNKYFLKINYKYLPTLIFSATCSNIKICMGFNHNQDNASKPCLPWRKKKEFFFICLWLWKQCLENMECVSFNHNKNLHILEDVYRRSQSSPCHKPTRGLKS